MTRHPFEHRVGAWLVLALACLAAAIAMRLHAVPCTSLVAMPIPDVDVATLPISAAAGVRTERRTWFGSRRFDQEIGAFRLACETTNDGHYWDYDHCLLVVPKCASEPLDLQDRYGLFANLSALRVGSGGALVLTDAIPNGGRAYAAFRVEPTGRRAGLLPALLASLAIGFAALGMIAQRRKRFETTAFVLVAISGAISFGVIATILARL